MIRNIGRRAAMLLLPVGALAAFALPGAALAQEKSAKLGIIVQLTGSSATYGVGIQHAVEIARQEMKDAGVIDLETHYEDHQQQPQLAVQGLQKLADIQGINLILANSSPVNLALNPFAAERGILIYNYNAVSPALRALAPWIINGNPLADVDGKKLAEYMIAQGHTSAGVISQNSEFGEAVSAAFNRFYEEAGGKIVAHEVSDERVFDMRTQLLKIKDANPQALVIFLNIPENGYTVAQAREIGLNAQVYSNQFLLSPDNFKVAGEAMNGVRGVSPKFDIEAPNAKGFADKFTAAAGRAPQASDAFAYDGTRMIGEAVAAVGTDSQAVRDYIIKLKDWPGAVGNYNFDTDGVADLPFEYYEVKDMKAVFTQ